MVKSEWQPIETAPKDGAEVIGIYCAHWGDETKASVYGPWTMAYSPRAKEWQSSWSNMRVIEYQGDFGTDYHALDVQPTHWMPLPSPPAPLTGGRENG